MYYFFILKNTVKSCFFLRDLQKHIVRSLSDQFGINSQTSVKTDYGIVYSLFYKIDYIFYYKKTVLFSVCTYSMTTVEFNPQTFFRFLHSSFISRNNFQFKVGMNHDTQAFDSSESCSPGLFYITIDYLKDFENQDYGDHIAIVKIPVGVSIVPVGEDKFKSPCVYIESIHLYTDFLKNDTIVPEIKRTMKVPDVRMPLHQTECNCRVAVSRDGCMIKYINLEKFDPLIIKEFCKNAVEKNGKAISYIKDQYLDKDIVKTALKNIVSLRFFKDLDRLYKFFDEKMWLEVIYERPGHIKYVPEKYLSKELCKTTLTRYDYFTTNISDAFNSYHFPSDLLWIEIIKLSISNIEKIHPSFLTENVWKAAAEKQWTVIFKSDFPLIILEDTSLVLKIMDKIKRKDIRMLNRFLHRLKDTDGYDFIIYQKAVEKNPLCIKVITEAPGLPTDDHLQTLVEMAVKKDGRAFFCLPDGYYKFQSMLCREAIKSHGNAIKYFIENIRLKYLSNFELCEIAISAVEQNPFSVRYAIPFFNKYYKGDKTEDDYKEYYNRICKSAIRKDYRCISYIKPKNEFFELVKNNSKGGEKVFFKRGYIAHLEHEEFIKKVM